ncbi:MAG: SpoIVB peptidase [Oscillospiraceae bacterium]|jgi:stage IV sporulation protein B|nr:SpoIVB peptidase [Oscillospiraceae bacterium]
MVQRAAAFLLVCGMVYLGFIGYGMHALPEQFTVTNQQQLAQGAPYSAQTLAGPMEAAGVPSQDLEDPQASADVPKEISGAFKFLKFFPVKPTKITVAKRSYVVAGGDIFGIKLYTKGVLVAKTDLVATQNGNANPAQTAGLRSGDVITKINGSEVNRKKEVSDAIEQSGGTPLQITVERGGSELQLECTPVKSALGDKYIAGLWIRDSSAGIGTVTFYDKKSNTLAGLGHAICDVDSGEVIPISGGELVSAKVMGCYKGVDGTPGELCGVFEPQQLATLERNGETGVYGQLGEAPPDGELMPVALKSEVKPGPAEILVTVSGKEKHSYQVEITRVSPNSNSVQKNMTIKVTDPALIEATGGIVQGMSGSPLIQDGMLAGAVTHVFVNSPLEGYAIYAETMLETARHSSAQR